MALIDQEIFFSIISSGFKFQDFHSVFLMDSTHVLEVVVLAYVSCQRKIALEGAKQARKTLVKTITIGPKLAMEGAIQLNSTETKGRKTVKHR